MDMAGRCRTGATPVGLQPRPVLVRVHGATLVSGATVEAAVVVVFNTSCAAFITRSTLFRLSMWRGGQGERRAAGRP